MAMPKAFVGLRCIGLKDIDKAGLTGTSHSTVSFYKSPILDVVLLSWNLETLFWDDVSGIV
jgi:hypothetical protein